MQDKFEPLEYQRELAKLLEQQHAPGHRIKMVVSGRGRRPTRPQSIWRFFQEFTQLKVEQPK